MTKETRDEIIKHLIRTRLWREWAFHMKNGVDVTLLPPYKGDILNSFDFRRTYVEYYHLTDKELMDILERA